MPRQVHLTACQTVTITTVVDNSADALLPSTPHLRRWPLADCPLLAEPGLALHVQASAQGRTYQLLLDAGATRQALPYNLPRLGLDARQLDALILSHGHPDHVAAVLDLLGLANHPLPVVVHPAAFRAPGGEQDGAASSLDRRSWELAGAQLVESAEPLLVGPALISGSIPRQAEPGGTPLATSWPEPVPDEQALVFKLASKGLVVITGCGHAGLLNILRHAQELTGVQRIYAVVGGFHLGRAPAQLVDHTIAALKALRPEVLLPAHCTGSEALERLMAALPGQCLRNSVGSALTLGAAPG
ncbi:MAG: MBL fold metallo-hydrolase [Deinococcus sp.]|nr:MBL fold metallo-hydrolase [Deinococcus sp.]